MSQRQNIRQRLTYTLITTCQLLIGPPCKLFLRMRGGYTANVEALPAFDPTARYVIAANHQSLFDPFALFTVISPRVRRPLLPIKFMARPTMYHKWYLKPGMFALGCYPAHIKHHAHHTYGVSGSVKLLQQGYNICIFPEGRRTLREDSDPKSGVVRILQQHPNAKLLLAHLEWRRGKRGKKHLHIVVAPAPDVLNITDPKAIMNAIYAL